MALQVGAREQAVRADLAALPAQLQRIDGWIDSGLLGGEQPNAADLQIGSTVRLLRTVADLRALIDALARPSSRATSHRRSAKCRPARCPRHGSRRGPRR